ncbi:MAG: exosortase/archaeosortase family protein [Candidatus Helarchaeota archaeon]
MSNESDQLKPIVDITPKDSEKERWPLKQSLIYFLIVVVLTIFLLYISEIVEFFYNLFGISYGCGPNDVWTIDLWLRYSTSEGASIFLRFFNISPSFTQISYCHVLIYPNIPPMEYPYALEIIKLCTGIEAMALLTALVVATPTKWWKKIVGGVFMVLGIYFANVLRIVITIVLLMNGFTFYIAHEVLAATMTIVFTIIFVLIVQMFIIRNFIDSMIQAVIGIYYGLTNYFKTK